MIVKNAEFETSIKDIKGYSNTDLPEIAISGKSNVGKSSLINFLAGQRRLAYTSKKPGKTRLINFFKFNGSFYLVDLPGYGFSKVSKEEKASWNAMVEDYFKETKQLKLLLVLLDIRHDPTPDDMQMIAYASFYGIPCALIATKADKIAKSKRKNVLAHIRKITGMVGFEMAAVSAQGKFGEEDLLSIMEKYLI
jgi:GTP-binding protein